MVKHTTPSTAASKANEQQVGGSHYKGSTIEHWDLVVLLGLDYFQAQITRYLYRWRKKNGMEDLRKAQHYLTKYIEVAPHYKALAPKPYVSVLLLQLNLDKHQELISRCLFVCRKKKKGVSVHDLRDAQVYLDEYIEAIESGLIS
jgi:Protein of unknwon function (DUF3310)